MDRDRLARLYAEYGPIVHRRACAVLTDDDEARDVMHDVFITAMARLPEDPKAHLPWLYRVTTHACIGVLRKRKVRAHTGLDAAVGLAAPGSGEGEALRRDQVLRILSRVDAATAALAVYAYVDGMGLDEIARVAGVSRKTVGKRLERFRAKARRVAGT